MNRVTKGFVICAVLTTAYLTAANACTDVRLTAKDGTVLVARSMEFPDAFNSHLRSSTRSRAFTTTVNSMPGLQWTAKYGYLYLDGEGYDFVSDGMNEAGLSFEALYLPGETQYQQVPAGKNSAALPYLSLGDWILGNFQTIEQVRAAITKIYVVSQLVPGKGNFVFPLHFSVFDKSGQQLIIEYVGGKLQISNGVGIMTNSPTYAWHVSNLKNYLNLSPYNPNPVTVAGVTYTSTGQGAGAIGLPGDFTPPSRFIRIAFLAKNAYPANDAAGLLNLAEHTMNDVDIANGVSRCLVNGKDVADHTQWVVFKDLTHNIFYYRTYNNLTIRAVNMNQIDLSKSAVRLNMPIDTQPYMMDMTSQFKASSNN